MATTASSENEPQNPGAVSMRDSAAPIVDSWTQTVFNRALLDAARGGDANFVRQLLGLAQEPGRSLSVQEAALKRDAETGLTALESSIIAGDEASFDLLLPFSDISESSRPRGMRPPLTMAAFFGNARLVERLLPLSDPAALDHIGATALLWAAWAAQNHAGHGLDACELLLPVSNANFSCPSLGGGETPFQLAISQNSREWVEAFLPYVDVNAQNLSNMTPLMWAAHKEADQSLEALLTAGANPRFQGSAALSALMIAAAQEKPECAFSLISVSDLDQRDQDGLTALHYALDAGREGAARALLEAMGPPNAAADDLLAIAREVKARDLAVMPRLLALRDQTDAFLESWALAWEICSPATDAAGFSAPKNANSHSVARRAPRSL